MTLHELKSTLQNHLTDGLVIVVGSGLSCAEGLPGMSELAEHLRMKLPEHLSADDLAIWEELAASIQVVGLEAALLMHQTPAAIECAITKETARLIVEGERKVIQEVFDGVRTLRLTRLIPHLV